MVDAVKVSGNKNKEIRNNLERFPVQFPFALVYSLFILFFHMIFWLVQNRKIRGLECKNEVLVPGF